MKYIIEFDPERPGTEAIICKQDGENKVAIDNAFGLSLNIDTPISFPKFILTLCDDYGDSRHEIWLNGENAS